MPVSIFDLFSIGIGPSSSHTVGPMRAARSFVLQLDASGHLDRTAAVVVELYGSLALTGRSHGTDTAVLLGLEGQTPETVDVDRVDDRLRGIRESQELSLLGTQTIKLRESEHLLFHRRESLPYHPNGMRFTAYEGDGGVLQACVYYSVGGGFVVDEATAQVDETRVRAGEAAAQAAAVAPDSTLLPYPFSSADELLAQCRRHRLTIAALMLANEGARRPKAEVASRLLALWQVMRESVERGCRTEGILPGGLNVGRRAPAWYRELESSPDPSGDDSLRALDWVNLWAMAVNEENAAGGRMVTAPTNGAAGIIPAVLHYYDRFVRGADQDGIVRFLLTAGAIGILYKENASISGAEVGCQGEVGSACSMAAGGLAEVLGGTPAQVENAAEIGMEHNLGLTCDPIGGLVQIPCIERNAMAAIKAINAARMALRGDGSHYVSLDRVIKTMRDTGADMATKYKETARGGLAVNVPVNVIEC